MDVFEFLDLKHEELSHKPTYHQNYSISRVLNAGVILPSDFSEYLGTWRKGIDEYEFSYGGLQYHQIHQNLTIKKSTMF